MKKIVQIDNTGFISRRKFSLLGAISHTKRERLTRILQSNMTEPNTLCPEDRSEILVSKCKNCLEILLENDDLEIEENKYIIECCILKPSGRTALSSTTEYLASTLPIRSVKDAIDWIKHNV